jgi:hypothetical protein
MTDWNDDLKDMFAAQFMGTDEQYKEWLESLSDDEYLNHILGKLNPPWTNEEIADDLPPESGDE